MRWPLLRPAEPPVFDAVVALGPYNLPDGITAANAIPAVRQAVSAIPGARWVTIEHQPYGSTERAVAVAVIRPGGSKLHRLRQDVLAAVMAALDRLQAPPAVTRAPGFADVAAPFVDWAAPQASPAGSLPTPPALSETSDAGLLAALLARVAPESAAAAERAVSRHGSFAAVLALPPRDLLAMPGFGPHSVAAIKLVHAAALRVSRAAIMQQPALTSFDALITYLTAVLAREPLEHFRILFLDSQGQVQADEAQARGTVNHTPVYPREVVRRALELGASSVILVHNHPSGDPTPSPADFEMTQLVQAACRVVGLAVEDHIIVGNGRWFSFRREGHLGYSEEASSQP